MQVTFVRSGRQSDITITVDPDDTVLQIKEKIYRKKGISVGSQVFIHDGITMANDYSYQLYDGARVTLLERAAPDRVQLKFIRTRSNGGSREIALTHYLNSTIAQVKESLLNSFGVSSLHDIELYFMGDEMMNQQVLSDFQVYDRCKINVVNL